jgi:CTP synthase
VKIKNFIREIKENKTKFIVITGGVCSSIGKGVLASSIGVLLKNAGHKISIVKMDPYLNVDSGTMSPLEHGEVFVTNDGAETDLDLGHYERTLEIELTKESSISSGKIFQDIIKGEREGNFLGKCVQLVPHVVNAIKERILSFACKSQVDFVLLEIGGTVGDIEGQVFLEAIRQLRIEIGSKHLFHGHLSYLPFLDWSGEVKTKPTQHSVNALKEAGLVPDGLFLRVEQSISAHPIKKLSVMCGVAEKFIFQISTFKPLFKLFPDLKNQQVDNQIQHYFGIRKPQESNISHWENLIAQIEKCKQTIKIALVAKYVGNNDPYISVIEAIKAAGYACGVMIDVIIIDSEELGKTKHQKTGVWENLNTVEGIVGPGGFDKRGIIGKLEAVRWSRENSIPYLGLCLGLQVMLIEIGRSLAGFKKANSTEFDSQSEQPIISLLEEQKHVINKGASMRLGLCKCRVLPETKAHEAYQMEIIQERHRHRYEFNNEYKEAFERAGVVFSGIYEEQGLIEIAELSTHPFMLGTQFHPEFLSSPLKPHPLFIKFIQVVLAEKSGGAVFPI